MTDITTGLAESMQVGARTLARRKDPPEWRLVALHDGPPYEQQPLCDTPPKVADYWRERIATSPNFSGDVEHAVVLLLNTRRRVKGHFFVATGTIDTLLIHPREVFRPAIVGNAAAIILMHNHPSGDPNPSEADVRITRDLLRAGSLLNIELLDHIIMGRETSGPGCRSLRDLGYLSV